MSTTVPTDRVVYFGAGVAIMLMVYSVVRHSTSLFSKEPPPTRNILGLVEDNIGIDALATLAQCDSIILQGGSVRILLGKAMKEQNLFYILDTVVNSRSEEKRWKGITTLQLLTRNDSNKDTLVEAGALEALVSVLKNMDNRVKSHRYATVSICELISGSEARRKQVVQDGILGPLKWFLRNANPADELQYWSLMVIHQLSFCESLHAELISAGMMKTMAEISRLSYGNATLPKICLQSLVRLVVTMEDDDDIRFHLAQIIRFDIVPLIAVYIQRDDFELVYWSVGLMHEFVIKGVAVEQFKRMKGICNSMSKLLAADEAHICRVVLRTLKFLLYDDPRIQDEALKAGVGLRLNKCLSSKDDDIKYWALSLAHEFAKLPAWRKQLIESGVFAQVINIGLSAGSSRRSIKAVSELQPASKYVTDILVDIWSSENELELLLEIRGLVEATCVMLQMEKMHKDISTNKIAIVLAKLAKKSEVLDRRLTRYGVNLNHPEAPAFAGIIQDNASGGAAFGSNANSASNTSTP